MISGSNDMIIPNAKRRRVSTEEGISALLFMILIENLPSVFFFKI